METEVRGAFYAFEASSNNTFVLQNDESRMTILTSWEAEITSPNPGTIEVTLDPTFCDLRLRLILEDVDNFHFGADKIPNYFGKLMTNDFFMPIEAFIVEGGSSRPLA